jgi:glycosyltransferase involved in cell wall biosynthesis
VEVYEGEFSGRWLLRRLRNIDFIHIHWPSFFYSKPQKGKCLRGFILFSFFLILARLRGVRLIWTIHNLYPHERCVIPQLDTLTRKLLVRLGALFFIHGSAAEADVLREFPALAGRTVRIEHGSWIGHYPNTMACKTARARLGLAENEFVFLFIGTCNPYKNLEGLICAFEQLPGNATLIITGKFQDAAYEAEIKAAISRSGSRIILHSGFIQDEDMQIYFRACNAVTTPYNEILSSGSAILAMSFGRPVIGPAMGSLKNLIIEGCGFLYDPSHQPESLRDAMCAAMKAKFDEARIVAEALKLDWRESAKIVVNSLAGLLNQKEHYDGFLVNACPLGQLPDPPIPSSLRDDSSPQLVRDEK